MFYDVVIIFSCTFNLSTVHSDILEQELILYRYSSWCSSFCCSCWGDTSKKPVVPF